MIKKAKEKLWLTNNGVFKPYAVNLRKCEIFKLLGDWGRAERIYLECLKQAENSLDITAFAECIMGQASLRYMQGHYPETLELYKKAQNLYEKSGQKDKLENLHLSFGSLYARMSEYDQARECYQKALISAAGNKRIEMGVHLNLGLLFIQLEDYRQAYVECHQALDLSILVNDPKEIYKVRINLGIAARETGLLDEALECAEHTMIFASKIGEKRGYGMGCNNAGMIWQKKGDLDKAVSYFKEFLELAESMNDLNNQAIASNNLAGALLEQGVLAEAEKYFSKAYAIMTNFGNKIYQADSLFNLAQVRLALGDRIGANELLNKSITLGEEIKDNPYLQKYYQLRESLNKPNHA
jgi:tetratricopeptide (TPR) repeat protein